MCLTRDTGNDGQKKKKKEKKKEYTYAIHYTGICRTDESGGRCQRALRRLYVHSTIRVCIYTV